MRANRFRSDYVKIPTDVRFRAKISIDPASGCWLWTGTVGKNGYGQIRDENRRHIYAHRWAYERERGPIPAGLQIDHLCRNKRCVNPAHLEAVTRVENTRRWAATITHCKYGHEYTPETTGRGTSGWRFCRLCSRPRTAKRSRERRALQRQRKGKAGVVLEFNVVAKTEAA
jgi:hypothetical protein